jgi:hypothetical protein
MLSPMIWGNSIWACIHYVALGAPIRFTPEDKQNYKNFFLSIGPVLPCQKCSYNFQKHLFEIPIDDYLISNQKLFEWTVKLHNLVNLEQNKPQWTVEQSKLFYLSKKPVSRNKYYMFAVFIFVVLVFIFIKRKSI